MLNRILTGSFILTVIMFIMLSAALGFYFGYDTAGDYCRDVLNKCADRVEQSSYFKYENTDYRSELLVNFSILFNDSAEMKRKKQISDAIDQILEK